MRTTTGRRFLTVAIGLTLAFSLLAAGLGTPLPRAAASTLVPLTIEQMSQMADSIVYVRTTSTRAHGEDVDSTTGRPHKIETDVGLNVLSTLKGSARTERTIAVLGGTVDGLTLMVDTEPVFRPGDLSILFLDSQGRVIGGPQGKLAVVNGRVPSLGASIARTLSHLTAKAAGVTTLPALTPDRVVAALGDSAPVISSIDPPSGSAGTGTRVTISGSGFGAFQGPGHVDFFYRSGAQLMSAPVVSWSDSTIVCVVPTANMNNYPGSAGSGPVTVTNANGLTSSAYDFHVTFGYGGTRWSSPTCSFVVNPNTPDTSSEEAMVDAGALAWNPASPFKFVDAGTTRANTWSRDGRNEIFWTTSLANGILAQAAYWFSGATILESDIGFNDRYLWSDGTGGSYDIQTTATHELGHWLNLRDLYGPGDSAKVMYGFGDPGSVKRALQADDLAGIRWIYGEDTTEPATTPTPPPTTTPTTRPSTPPPNTTPPAPTVTTRVEQTSTRLRYTGTWTNLSNFLCSGGSMKQTTGVGATVTIAFTGTSLDLIARKGTASGIARITLDSGAPVTVDLYNFTTRYKQKVWSSGLLANGAHKVKIEYTGTKRVAASGTTINIDAVDVRGALSAASTRP